MGLVCWEALKGIDEIQAAAVGKDTVVYNGARAAGLPDGASRAVDIAATMPEVPIGAARGLAKLAPELARGTVLLDAGELGKVAVQGAAKGAAENPEQVATAGAKVAAELEAEAARATGAAAPQTIDGGVPHPSTPVGRSGNPFGSVGPNQPTTIGGRAFTGHAIDQTQARGILPSVVENTIQHGVPGRPQPVGSGTASYFDSVNNITVIADTASGRVVTVFPGQ